MPYIPTEPHRRVLDPYIDAIVEKISILRPVNIIQLFEAQLLTIKNLALLLHPNHKDNVLKHVILANQATPHISLRDYMSVGDTGIIFSIKEHYFFKGLSFAIDLAEKIELITKQTESTAWVGMLNYCCTEILLLSTDGRRYHVMSLLAGICDRVAYELEKLFNELEKLFNEDDEIGLSIVRVFRDISAEFYRRVVAPYEDYQISRSAHGDTRGYLKWMPQSEK